MINKLPTKSFLTLAGGLFLLNSQAGATVILGNDFNGTTVGPALQNLSNGNGPGSFNPTTGVITNTSGANNTVGFNTASLVTLDPDVDTITASFVVTSANVNNASANGFFLGVVTGTNATSQTGAGLFNNDPSAFGLHLLDGGVNANSGITQNDVFLGDTITATDDSINDGFTFTLTLRDDNTFDAVTEGLSTDINLQNLTFGATDPNFNDFLTGGIGLNSSLQATGGGSVTFDSVTLSVPEPSSAVLLIGGLGCLAFRRKR